MTRCTENYNTNKPNHIVGLWIGSKQSRSPGAEQPTQVWAVSFAHGCWWPSQPSLDRFSMHQLYGSVEGWVSLCYKTIKFQIILQKHNSWLFDTCIPDAFSVLLAVCPLPSSAALSQHVRCPLYSWHSMEHLLYIPGYQVSPGFSLQMSSTGIIHIGITSSIFGCNVRPHRSVSFLPGISWSSVTHISWFTG